MTYAIILAVLLDQWLGEPQKHHPLVFFGHCATHIESLLHKSMDSDALLKGRGLLALIVLVFPLTSMVYYLSQWDKLNTLIAPFVLYFCIAVKSLRQHANAVFLALHTHDLGLAKKKLALMVSRQTDKMTADNVRSATIESVLENGADAVFAPLFWFIIAGPAGAILYRLSNTLDAMWGYKNQRYVHFGWAVARFDDLLNFIPARLTAVSYALLGQYSLAIHCWKTQAHLLDSPNAGTVMTAGAGALNLQLGGPAWYHDKRKDKVFFGGHNIPVNTDIHRANKLITQTVFLWISLSLSVQICGGVDCLNMEGI